MVVPDLNNILYGSKIYSVDATFVFKDSKGKDNVAIFTEDEKNNKYLLWATPNELHQFVGINTSNINTNNYFPFQKVSASLEYSWEQDNLFSIIPLTSMKEPPKEVPKDKIEKLFGCEITP